jgi:hypothetical protein
VVWDLLHFKCEAKRRPGYRLRSGFEKDPKMGMPRRPRAIKGRSRPLVLGIVQGLPAQLPEGSR